MYGDRYEHAYPELMIEHLLRVDTPSNFNNDPLTHELIKYVGVDCLCYIKGRGLCGLQRLAFTTGLFYGYDDYGYVGRYCYKTKAEAVEALINWDGNGDPGGNWIKHKGISEYSNRNYEP